MDSRVDTVKQVIVVRKDLSMRKGKIAAQVAHAAMKFILNDGLDNSGRSINRYFSPAEAEWLRGSFTKVVVSCDSEAELYALIERARVNGIAAHAIIDAGRTEFHGVPTLTCAAFGPHNGTGLDLITGHLKLL